MEVVGSVSAVIALLGATKQAVGTFATFWKGLKTVDSRVSSFLREVRALLSSLEDIKKKMDELPSALIERGELELWKVMKDLLEECKTTVEDLTALFQKLNQESSRQSFDSALKQINYQFKTSEIAELRERIAKLQGSIQLSMGWMNLLVAPRLINALCADRVSSLAIDQRLELRKIGACLSSFQDIYDELKYTLKQLRESQVNGPQNQPKIRENQEKMLKAAKPMLERATNTLERLSAAGSEFGGEHEKAELQDHIIAWQEDISIADDPIKMPDLAPMESIYWPQNRMKTRILDTTSPERKRIRTGLIQQGVTAYSQGDYNLAFSCFRDANREGPIGANLSTDDEGVSDTILKAWLWLSEIRVNSRTPWARVNSDLMEPHVNLDALKRETRMQVCRAACTISLAFMHRGLIDKAVDICQAAQTAISNSNRKGFTEYAEAVLTMVEIQYSKGPTPGAKTWRELLLKEHQEILDEKATEFFLQKFDKPTNPTRRTERIQTLRSESEPDSDVKDRLYSAIERGNFPAALYIISKFGDQIIEERLHLPFQPDAGRPYLSHSVIYSHSVAVVSLLLQHSAEGGNCDRDSLDIALQTAAAMSFAGAIGPLVDAGASTNYLTSPVQHQGQEPCYAVDVSDTMATAMAHAVSRGYEATVKALLAKDAEVNMPLTTQYILGVRDVEPVLHVAIKSFSGRQLIPLLLEHGANVNTPFRDVRPLALAIFQSGKAPNIAGLQNISNTDERLISRKLVVELLIKKGAEVNRRSTIDGERVTPLQQARKKGLNSIERLLLDHGAVERRIISEIDTEEEDIIEIRGRNRFFHRLFR